MSETEYEMCFIPNTNAANPGKNHVLSRNPLTTRCGNFNPAGHEPAREDADFCKKCLNYVAGVRIEGRARPMRDAFKGNGR